MSENNSESYMQRHVDGLLDPASPEERTISTLLSELGRLADRWKNDYVMVSAVEHLGSAIIALLNGDVGRLDHGKTDSKVRAIVESAGGDPDEL